MLPQFCHDTGSTFRLNTIWAFVIEAAWAIASLYSLTRLLISILQMMRLYRASTRVGFAKLSREMQSIVTRPGQRDVEVRLSDAVDAPSVIGFFRPAIVVPRTLWNELPPEDMKQVLRHEMAHLERGDDWTNLLQKLLRALCPLNPALIWAERHLCREREQACDDAVLDAAGNARAYAICLTRLAESRLVKRAALLAPGLWKRHSELAARVENILHRRPRLHPVLSKGLVAFSLVGSLCGVSVLQLCPRLVTFANTTFANPETLSAEADPLHAPAADSTSARTYRAAYRAQQQQPRYEDAVFHPQRNDVKVYPEAPAHAPQQKPAKKTVHARVHTTPKVRSSSLHFVALRSVDRSAGIAWVIFTVNVSSDAFVSGCGLNRLA